MALAAATTAAAGVAAYRTGPPAGHTGAFGEPDCGACHFDAERGDTEGSVVIHAPAGFRPGESYDVRVVVRRPGLAAAGFQLSARFAAGGRCGQQAGTLAAPGPDTQVVEGDNGVAYASHSEAGVVASGEGVREWTLRWTAPASGGPVAFDVAANAANDDSSEFGDRLYSTRHLAEPSGEATEASGDCGEGSGG